MGFSVWNWELNSGTKWGWDMELGLGFEAEIQIWGSGMEPGSGGWIRNWGDRILKWGIGFGSWGRDSELGDRIQNLGLTFWTGGWNPDLGDEFGTGGWILELGGEIWNLGLKFGTAAFAARARLNFEKSPSLPKFFPRQRCWPCWPVLEGKSTYLVKTPWPNNVVWVGGSFSPQPVSVWHYLVKKWGQKRQKMLDYREISVLGFNFQ